MSHKPNPYLQEPPPPLRQPRGNLLNAFLLFLLGANLFGVARAVNTGNWLALVWAVFGLVCVGGLWRWSRWAYFALYIGFMYNIATALDTAAQGDLRAAAVAVMFQLTYMAVLYLLVHPRLNEYQ